MRINRVSDEYQKSIRGVSDVLNTDSIVEMILLILNNIYDTHDTHDMVRMCAEY